MRFTFLSSALLLAACGSSGKPSEAQPPSVTPTPAPPAKARFTCDAFAAKLTSPGALAVFANSPFAQRATLEIELRAAYGEACTADRWSDDVLACGARADDGRTAMACLEEHTDEQGAALTRRFPIPQADELPAPPPITDEMRKAAFAPPPAVLPACAGYIAMFRGYVQCEKVPAQARDAALLSLFYIQQSFAQYDANVAAEQIAAANDACRQGADAMRENAIALGCAIDTTLPPPKAQKPAKASK